MKIQLFVFVTLLAFCHALRCTTCGDDGVCKPNSEVKVQECKPGTKNCFISLGSDGNGSFVDVKGCADNTGNEFGLRGCLHISGNVKHEINDEYCFCDTDECNSHRCEMEFCSCAFSDPEMCRNITEQSYIKCRSCTGQGCEDGANAPLEECHHGEGSCLYSHMTVGEHVEIIRGCGEMYHGAIVEGCFDLKGWAGHDEFMNGQMCFCDEEDCNKDTCDPTNCDCVYADPNSCNSGSIIQTSVSLCILTVLVMFKH